MNKVEKYFPVLYVIVRNDLQSMNFGKAEAHSGHAGSQFVHHFMKNDIDNKFFKDWISAADGFGTQINLNANIDEVHSIKQACDIEEIPNSLVIDPTYPFIPPRHIANILSVDCMFREEVTAFWAFGLKDDIKLKRIFREFKLK